MKKWVLVAGVVVLGLLLIVGCAPKAEVALSPEDFYKGKTIDWSSPDQPGDTIDFMSRLMTPYIAQQTEATVVVTNLREAGGTEAFVHVYQAQPDGLHLGGATTGAMWMNEIMGAPGSESYQSINFGYLGGINLEPMVFVVSPKGPYQSVAALQAGKNMKLGGTSASGRYSIGAMSVAYLLDLDTKVITGAKGESALRLSIQQGEIVGGMLGTSIAVQAFKQGQLKPLFVLSTKRDSLFPDLPAITELVKLTGDKLEVAEAWANLSNIRVFMATPGTPADRVNFLRKIMSEKIFVDPAFRKQIDTRVGYQNDVYLTGDEVEKMAKSLFGSKGKIKNLFDVADKKYRG